MISSKASLTVFRLKNTNVERCFSEGFRGTVIKRVRKVVAEERERDIAREKEVGGDFSAGWMFQLNRRNHYRAPVPPRRAVHLVRRRHRSPFGPRFADERKFLHSTGP